MGRNAANRFILSSSMLSGSSMCLSQRGAAAGDSGPPREYEKQIQKLEGDVRTHIRVEQQLKLHIEGMQQQFDEILARAQLDLEAAQREAEDAKEGKEKAESEMEKERRESKTKLETTKKEGEDQVKQLKSRH